MFGNMKVSGRLGLGFGALLALLVAVAATGYLGMESLNGALHTVGAVNYPRIKLAQELSEAQYKFARDLRSLVLVQDEASMQAVVTAIDGANKEFEQAWGNLQKLSLSEQGKAILAKVKEAKDAAKPFNDKVFELGRANKTEEATTELMQRAAPANRKVQDLLNEFLDLQDKFINENIRKGEETHGSASFWMYLIVGVAVLAGIIIAFFITRSITRPLGGEPGVISEITDQIAGGDLTVRFADTGKETGIYAAMRAMAGQLKDMVTGLSLETLIVIPVKTGIQLFQRLTGFPLARERRKAQVLYLYLRPKKTPFAIPAKSANSNGGAKNAITRATRKPVTVWKRSRNRSMKPTASRL